MDTEATPRKIRKNLWLTPEAVRLTDEAAKREGVTPTGVIERAVRLYCGNAYAVTRETPQ